MRRPRLVWKLEEPFDTTPAGHDQDLGPAWIDFFDGESEKPTLSDSLDWMTRQQARQLARSNGYELVEDG